MSTTTRTIQSRMNALIDGWVRAQGVAPITASAAARASDVLVAVEVRSGSDAETVAAALRVACCADVRIYAAEGDDAPAMVTGAASDASLARLAA